ncbi:hypothetical protein [Pelotalea chapellei]|uniref:Lipoprotein n=1 Tax=Pelotalea chapellei TaxID=44671 RepID=A0ABS5U9T5_9BACT|nr:hypothetical protein [Pelotalea chapellei]MBT1072452.1 hypothetical protein [Pelotalea chapellei]
MKRLLLVCLLAAMITGCATGRYEAKQPQAYPSAHQAFDATFGWEKAVTSTGIIVNGYARNNRYFLMEDLELNLALLDSQGKEKADKVFFFIPSRLPQDDISYFDITLPVQPQSGDRLRFLYRYKGIEDSDMGIRWMSSFEVPALE